MTTKEYILALLESRRGQSISGEYIAAQLKVSRNAVWKAIKELEKDGYQISAATNLGYCLHEDNDILSVQGMLPYLQDKEASQHISIYDSLETTNKIAKKKAIAGAAHGSAVIAEAQTGGKGRYGRNFASPPGTGIYMSIVLCPKQFPFSAATLITASIAVSVCEAIEALSDLEVKPQIKWVNDIFMGGKKVCGISTEAAMDFETGSVQWIVVGIGVNFCKPQKDVPKELQEVFGTVFGEVRPSTTRNHLAAEILNRVAFSKAPLTQEEMLAAYRSRMFMLGEVVEVTSGDKHFEATALDIDDSGQLVVEKASGEIVTLHSGEVSARPKK